MSKYTKLTSEVRMGVIQNTEMLKGIANMNMHITHKDENNQVTYTAISVT